MPKNEKPLANPDIQADLLAAKAKHYLITTMGRTSEEANSEEVYRALSLALREQIMINWLATARTFQKEDAKTLYYFSMEFLPGRILTNNITNLNALEIVKAVAQKLNRNLNDIIEREKDPGLGNGGLGRLASCFLDSLATMHYPAMGYGLRYQYGIFEQLIWDGLQVEAPDRWLVNQNPWEFRRDQKKVFIKYCGEVKPSTNIHGDEIYFLKNFDEVQAIPYDYPIIGYASDPKFSVLTLRLWTTKESPRNFQLQRYNAGKLDQAAENTMLTDVLYPSDNHEVGKRIRLKQEFLLVSASLQDIIRNYLKLHSNFRAFADKVRIQINDTHPSLIIAELIRLLTKTYDLPWKMALDITMACTSYTNHTILSEALEQWDQGLMSYLLPRQSKVIERLNLEFCQSIRKKYPNDEDRVRRMSIIENGKIRMANLAIVGSHSTNGVAALHSELLRTTTVKDLAEIFPERFNNKTNGVTPRRSLYVANPSLSQVINDAIGEEWIKDLSQLRLLKQVVADKNFQNQFIKSKREAKSTFSNWLQLTTNQKIDPDTIFDCQIKRIHEYKRQMLNALRIIVLYNRQINNPNLDLLPRTFFFAGKAAPAYYLAKLIIKFINNLAATINNDSKVNKKLKIYFLPDYCVSLAERLIPASDVSNQISTAGYEASGTSNMKFMMNGAITIGTRDGATIEMAKAAGEENFLLFGLTAEQVAQSTSWYNPHWHYENEPEIRQALDLIQSNYFSKNEPGIFTPIFDMLMRPGEKYMHLADLSAYLKADNELCELYTKPNVWAYKAILNVASSGNFSSDRTIAEYASEIWDVKPCPLPT